MFPHSYEARLSALEQIIIIIVLGGGFPRPNPNPPGDSFASDSVRYEALMRAFRPGHFPPYPPGDSFASDITRASLSELESALHQVNAELTRLRAREGEINARLKDLRGESSGKSK
jgi:hypothetical protein